MYTSVVFVMNDDQLNYVVQIKEVAQKKIFCDLVTLTTND